MMRGLHARVRARGWLWPVLLILLLAGHGLILRAATTWLALPVAAVVGVVLLLAIRHGGPLGSLFGRLRRGRSSRDD